MTVQIIPIEDAGTNGAFYFTVDLDGVTFQLAFQFNSREGFWYYDIQDLEGNVIRSSVKAVINWLSIRLDQSQLRPAGELLFIDTRTEPSDPGLDDLGENVVLGYIPEADL
jgi:hypothetical protein